MKTKIEINLKPIRVPNYILIDNPINPDDERKFRLEELDSETLESLCEQFTESVFKKAGKKRPPIYRSE